MQNWWLIEKDLVNTVLKYQPLFIKPNKDELEEMFDMTVESDQDVVKYGREILKGCTISHYIFRWRWSNLYR